MSGRTILLTVLLAGCAAPEEVPSGLLPREKFTEVLLEAQLIEARVNHGTVIDKKPDMPDGSYYAAMFRSQGVTEEAFKTTYAWYVEHPAELKAVYNEVLTGLQKRVDEADSSGNAH